MNLHQLIFTWNWWHLMLALFACLYLYQWKPRVSIDQSIYLSIHLYIYIVITYLYVYIYTVFSTNDLFWEKLLSYTIFLENLMITINKETKQSFNIKDAVN